MPGRAADLRALRTRRHHAVRRPADRLVRKAGAFPGADPAHGFGYAAPKAAIHLRRRGVAVTRRVPTQGGRVRNQEKPSQGIRLVPNGGIFGRDEELKALAAAAEAARRGTAGCVLVTGPAGRGKTAVLRALLRTPACRDATVLNGRCPRADGGTEPYSGLRALLNSPATARQMDRHPAPCGGIGSTEDGREGSPGPGLGADPTDDGGCGAGGTGTALLPDPADVQPVAAQATYSVFRGLHRYALRLMADRPLILALDDAHDCDGHTLRWLGYLLARAAGRPLLVVLGRRTGTATDAPDAWADLVGRPTVGELPLQPLGTGPIGDLAHQVFGTPVHPPFAERITELSGGSPDTAARLLRALHGRGAAPDASGARLAEELGVRLKAEEVQRALAHQPAPVRRVVVAAALLGAASTEHVAALAGVSRPVVEEGVAVLEDVGALSPEGDGRVCEAVRPALLDPLGAARITELHARAALVLSDAGCPAEQIARHLVELPGPPEAWMTSVLREAAAQAERRGAFTVAARCLRRVLEAEPHDVRIRLRLARAVAPSDPAAALPLFRVALAGAADVTARAVTAVECAMASLNVPVPEPGREQLVQALEGARDALPRDTEAGVQLRAQVSATLLIMGRRPSEPGAAGHRDGPVGARLSLSPPSPASPQPSPSPTSPPSPPLSEPSVSRIPLPPHPSPDGADTLRTRALTALRGALSGRCRAAAVADARHVLDAAGPEQPAWPLLNAAVTFALADETEEAHTALDRVLHRVADDPAEWTRVRTQSVRAAVVHRDGAVLDAVATARALIGTADGPGRDSGLTTARAVLAAALVDRGRPQQAEQVIDRIGSPQPAGTALEHQTHLLARARVHGAVGDSAEALRLLRECGRIQEAAGWANPVSVPWWSEACLILAALRRPAEGRELAELGAERAERWGTPRALGLAALAGGVLGPGRAGLDLLSASVHHLSGSPAVLECARAEYELGWALLLYGDASGGRRYLRRAAGRAGGCGAVVLAGAARRLLISAGGRMGNSVPSRVGGILTPTEAKVAGMVVAGAANRQIAQRLFVTVRTVESHLTSVYRKLGVSRRDGLAVALRAVRGRTGHELPDEEGRLREPRGNVQMS
ncbi:helix-turn-helix transcriptional regulator [Streptomyces cacaoi]|uniref:helix-turn-helix transcriptional regulator n=1 Tax=Streptomyces cacaoi TaxID=1898 RepID=UPI000A3AB960|nr:LuxR family transcriptional regulator [Streptomyces cacaoi]